MLTIEDYYIYLFPVCTWCTLNDFYFYKTLWIFLLYNFFLHKSNLLRVKLVTFVNL